MEKQLAILSDAGDILFPSRGYLQLQKEILHSFFNEDTAKPKLSLNQVYLLWRPFKIMSHTTISLEDAMNRFFDSYGLSCRFDDYSEIYDLKSKEISSGNIFPGATQFLEQVSQREIPFIIASDATSNGEQMMRKSIESIIVQLKELNLYNHKTFDQTKYLLGCVTSKDLGVKKPHRSFIAYALNLVGKDKRIIFLGHESDEVIGMANLGLDVISLDFHKEPNAGELLSQICDFNAAASLEKSVLNRIYLAKGYAGAIEVIDKIRKN